MKLHIQVHEEHKIPNKMNPKRLTARCIIIKMAKIKDMREYLKKKWKPTSYIKRTITRLSIDFPVEALPVKGSDTIFKELKGETLPPRILYLERLKIKNFTDKLKLRI